MLSSMLRVGKRRVRGVHMIRNETGEAQGALRKSEKKGPKCNRKQPLNKSLQQLLTTKTTEKKKDEAKEDTTPGQPAPTKLCFNE